MKKLLLTLFILIFAVSAFASCGESEKPIETDENTVLIDKVENLEKYVFVDMQTHSNVSAVISDLQSAIKDATGVSLKVAAAYQKNEYEILVGKTNRKESIDAAKDLKYFDYCFRMINNKIVITAGSDEALLSAAEIFKKEFIYPEGQSLYMPAEYTFKHEYLGEGLTIEGIDIKNFKILNKSCLTAEEIAERLLEIFDFEFQIVTEETEGEHYIILDASSYIYEDYSVTIENGNIHFYGSARSMCEAIDSFFEGLGENKALTSAYKLEGKIEKPHVYTKDQLMAVLTEVYNDPGRIIIGEHGRGTPQVVTKAVNNFEAATGEKPGIIDIELKTDGMGIFAETEPYVFSSIICDIVDYAAEGGIFTFTAHWKNPSGNYPDEENTYRGVLGYDNTLAGYEKAFTDLLTVGTEYNAKWMEEIDREVEFFLALQNNGVPAIWRPLHETNGNWFWFCTTQAGKTLDASYVKNIWYYIHDYFAEKGIENLLWMYAPNISDNPENEKADKTMDTTYLYPGDEYCDLVGVDWYTQGELEIVKSESYLRLLDTSRKIGCITEFGPSGAATNENGVADPEYYSSMNLCRDLEELITEGYSFTYLLAYGGSWSFKLMGEGEEFMKQEMTLGQADVKALFDALK